MTIILEAILFFAKIIIEKMTGKKLSDAEFTAYILAHRKGKNLGRVAAGKEQILKDLQEEVETEFKKMQK